jgi:hypothetical protein
MNPAKVVASGWSIGGCTAMVLVAGDDEVCDLADLFPDWPVPPETCVPTFPDPRISRITPLDGSNLLLRFQEMARVDVPVLGIGEEWNAVGDWQARQHAAFTGHPAYRVDVFNTVHPSFSNTCIGWEPNVEFFVTERKSPNAIDEDWPDTFIYFMHQPGSAHSNASTALTAFGVMDPTGARPKEFAFRAPGDRGF